MSSPLFSINAPIVRSWAVTMCSSPGGIIIYPRSWRAICNFFAGSYSPMSNDITVLLFSLQPLSYIPCLHQMVSSVCHPCAGAESRGELSAPVNGMGLLIVGLYPDHTGMSVIGGWSYLTPPLVIATVKLCPRGHVKSCFLMYNGMYRGKMGPAGFPRAQGILAMLSQTREAVWLSDDPDLRDL